MAMEERNRRPGKLPGEHVVPERGSICCRELQLTLSTARWRRALLVFGETATPAARRRRRAVKWIPRASAKLVTTSDAKGEARVQRMALGELGDGSNGVRELAEGARGGENTGLRCILNHRDVQTAAEIVGAGGWTRAGEIG